MTKWYQSTGTYQSLFFKDLLYLDKLLTKSIKEKRELLVTELFTNKVEVGDIPPDIPITAVYYIDFLLILAEDVCKAIIEVYNTAPGIDKVPIVILQASWLLIYIKITFFFQ